MALDVVDAGGVRGGAGRRDDGNGGGTGSTDGTQTEVDVLSTTTIGAADGDDVLVVEREGVEGLLLERNVLVGSEITAAL